MVRSFPAVWSFLFRVGVVYATPTNLRSDRGIVVDARGVESGDEEVLKDANRFTIKKDDQLEKIRELSRTSGRKGKLRKRQKKRSKNNRIFCEMILTPSFKVPFGYLPSA